MNIPCWKAQTEKYLREVCNLGYHYRRDLLFIHSSLYFSFNQLIIYSS